MRPTICAAVAVLGLLFAVLAPAGTAGAEPGAPVGLTVTLTDGLRQVHPNTDLSYVAILANTGPRPLHVRLVLDTPSYVTLTHAPGANRPRAHRNHRARPVPGHHASQRLPRRGE